LNFDLDEPQREIAHLASEVLGRETDPANAWKALGRAGLLTLAVPEDLGGAGLGVLETALVLTEVGRVAAELPALETLALGVLPIARAGTGGQRRELLGAVTDGAVLTAGIHEPSASLATAPHTVAVAVADGWIVTGTLLGVRSAAEAYRVLVPVSLDAGARVLIVDPTAPGVTVTPTRSSAGLPEATVRLDQVRVGPDSLLGGSERAGGALEELYRCAVVGACALGDGLVAGALGLTADHLRTREQFGRPLAAFQAVAQQVADVYLASRTLHLAGRAAAWRLEPDDVAVAGYWLAERALPALHTCQHLHGGLGMDVSYPLHRYYAQTRDLTRFVGGVHGAEQRLADLACS
jgi:hypothetical protein